MSIKRRRLNSSDEPPGDPPKAKLASNDLCKRCNAIEWSLLAEKSKSNLSVDYFHEAVTKTHKELRLSPCQVCQLLSLLKSSDLDNSSCALNAIGLYKFFTGPKTRRNHLQLETSIISIVSEGSKPLRDRRQLGHVIAVEPSPQASSVHLSRGFEKQNVDFEFIADCMAACTNGHPECEPGIPSSTEALEVIDCTNPKCMEGKNPTTVNLPPGCKYAALSYVWGGIKDDFPQVVKDSVKVVSKLKCKYLWVDRLCIPQEVKGDEERRKKKRLIERMDEIYSQACFTLVDAAGEDSNYGLAGVSHRRMAYRYIEFDGVKLTYLGTPPAEKIRSSRWASRGWTYQEGILSHRRIFFTDEQVMFQCNTMACIESFPVPMKPKTRTDHRLKDAEPLNLAPKDVAEHTMEFSKRDLTDDDDSLRAFSGVLNYFHKKDHCFHLQGNPIPTEEGKGHLINAWYHPKPAARNITFPSWSWTGWKGEVRMTSRDHPDYDLRVFEPKNRDGHQGDEHSISLDGYIEACGTSPSREMRLYIEMKGKMTTMSFELIKWDSEAIDSNISVRDGAWAILPEKADTTYYSFLYLDEDLAGIGQSQLPVMVLESGIQSPEHNIVILVLRQTSDRFERVGMVILRRRDNAERGKLTLYRDKSGNWVQPTSIPHLQEFVWWKRLRNQVIQVQ